MIHALLIAALLLVSVAGFAQGAGPGVHISRVADEAWARNSVNTTVFRHAVVSHGEHQFTAFYDDARRVVLAKRSLGSDEWTRHTTAFTGNADDAHNGINLGLDGDGYLHLAWDHHANPLRYARSVRPMSTEMSEPTAILGRNEKHVTYPQFFTLPDGRLLLLYRDGGSGNGNLVINRYDPATKMWQRLHDNLLDGQGQRNAYWQAAVDPAGGVHLAWVWRETGDVASNHDLAYARSDNAGQTWQTIAGQSYDLPINADTSDYALRIPQNHGLINQTGIAGDAQGRPYIATYFRPLEQDDAADPDVPQYWLIHHDGTAWQRQRIGQRTTPFTLGGHGTRRTPMARPQVAVGGEAPRAVHVVFRDQERGDRVTVASRRLDDSDAGSSAWTMRDLTDDSFGQWEPAFDHPLWQRQGQLHLFVQKVTQVDAEGLADSTPTPASILQWTP